MDIQIIQYLKDNSDARPIDIARAVGKSRSDVNGILYVLQKLGRVKRVALKENGGDPRWSLVPDEDPVSVTTTTVPEN